MKLRSLAVNQSKKFSTPVRLDGIDDGDRSKCRR